MEIRSLTPLRSAEAPPAKLAANPVLDESEKLGELSRQFEAVLIRKILNEAQKPVFNSPVLGSAVCGDVYRDLMTNELAHQISRSGLGLAQCLKAQLQRQVAPAPNSEINAADPVPGARAGSG